MGLSNLRRNLWTKSPQDYWNRVFGPPQTYRPWATGKSAQWNRLPFYLQMMRATAQQAGRPLDFTGKRVLEIGAGPVLGLIPFVLLEGASEGGIIEPDYIDISNERGFHEEYLYPLYHLYRQVLGKTDAPNFPAFIEATKRIRVERRTLEHLDVKDAPFDIIVSKSCLEHIADLPSAVRVSRSISSPGSLHIHYVDFSMHYTRDQLPGNLLGKTYQQARADNPEFLANPGGIVNLLRPSEMIAAFRQHFSEVHFFPSVDYKDRAAMLNLGARHADWKKYEESDLTIAHGVVLAVA